MAALFRRILVPHDFSPQATHAFKHALALAKRFDGRVVAQHVIVPFYVPADVPFGLAADTMPAPATFVPEQRARLEKLVKRAAGADGARVTVRVDVGDPAQCILDAAQRADAIVMATSGRTGLAHLLIGSVAEKVVRHAPVPVLTVRAPAARGAGR